jgi:hypothetical protein
MSGEMNTSLGNGFFNMMVTLFLASRRQSEGPHPVTMEKFIDNYFHHVKGVFEGDDGLTTFSPDCQLKTEHYTDLGLLIKLEDHKELGTASFCGNLFDEIDLVQITDPLRVVATIGGAIESMFDAMHEQRMHYCAAKPCLICTNTQVVQ